MLRLNCKEIKLMKGNGHIGIDIGGTNISGGVVKDGVLSLVLSQRINARGSAEEVLLQLFELTDQLVCSDTASIGIGVPGLVDNERRIVFDVVNIPSWKDLPLQKFMEDRYQLPVFINNDANCFALGEFYYGKGRGCSSMLGVTVGTGLGTGMIINKQLYAGRNCGAGEFGMMDYLDQCYEYYASGQFFQNVYNVDGEIVFGQAKIGNMDAISKYQLMGIHLGNAIKAMLYALDVELIVLGGSVRHAWPYFHKAMWQRVETFAFKRALQGLRIEVSTLENSGILGAAALGQ